MIAHPCGVCSRPVAHNHKAIVCDICQKWIHLGCNKFDDKDDKFFQDDVNFDEQFFCLNCVADNIAFSRLNNNEFEVSVKKGVINSDDIDTNFIQSDYHRHVFDQLNMEINNNAFDFQANNDDIDNNIVPAIDCKYYSIDDFRAANFNPKKSFSILHFNIHSIELHIEEFRVILQLINFDFYIICISESKKLLKALIQK